MIHPLIVHNGRLGPLDRCLSPGQAGLLTGWGVFSTLRVYDGVPVFFELHWQRLLRDAERIRVEVPFPPLDMRENLLWLINANGAQEAAARIFLVRNEGGSWSAPSEQPTDFLLFTASLHEWPASVRLSVTPQGRHAASPLAGTKVLSWVDNVGKLEELQQRGFDETVLLNERGEVSECTSANVFAVNGDRLLTPPLDSGCLPGVTRHVIEELAPASGLKVEERTLLLDDLYGADEVFISSTTRELIPVREIENRALAQAWPVTARLHEAYRQRAGQYVEEHRPQPARA